MKTDPLASAQVLKNYLGLLWVYSCVLAQVALGIAERIRAILPIDGARWPSAKAALQQDWLQPVLAITSLTSLAETLIRKISEGEEEALTQRFAGKMPAASRSLSPPVCPGGSAVRRRALYGKRSAQGRRRTPGKWTQATTQGQMNGLGRAR